MSNEYIFRISNHVFRSRGITFSRNPWLPLQDSEVAFISPIVSPFSNSTSSVDGKSEPSSSITIMSGTFGCLANAVRQASVVGSSVTVTVCTLVSLTSLHAYPCLCSVCGKPNTGPVVAAAATAAATLADPIGNVRRDTSTRQIRKRAKRSMVHSFAHSLTHSQGSERTSSQSVVSLHSARFPYKTMRARWTRRGWNHFPGRAAPVTRSFP